MPGKRDDGHQTWIESVAGATQARVSGRDQADAVAWARQLYASVTMRDGKGLNPADLAGAALALWTFAADRRPGLPKVRVYRPSPARDGWSSPLTIVETVNEDMPFLVDSVAAYLNGTDREVRWIVHPVVAVRRDAAGHRTELLAAGASPAGAVRESVMQFHLAPQPEGAFEAIRAGVEQVLAAVRQAMADVAAMRQRLLDEAALLGKGVASVPPAELQSAQDFLRWLADDHFVLLGYREAAFLGTGEAAHLQTRAEKSLGLLREEGFTLFDGLMRQPSLPDLVRDTLQRRTLVRVTKASRRSPVHRPIPLDVVTVQTMDARGGITGERTLVGLFPLSVYAVSPRQVPLLAAKIDAVLQRAGYPPEGHRGKHLLHILETYPRDELFQVTADELYDLSTGILELQDRLHVALFARRDPFGRFVSCLVYAPRDRYDSTLRRRFAQILERAYGGTLHNFSVNTGDVLSRVHFLIATPPGAARDVDDEAVEQQLQEAARGWPERLQDALVQAVGGEQGMERYRRLGSAFPASYQEAHDAAAAAVDAAYVDQALATGDLAVNLYRAPGAPLSTLRFKVYFTGRTAPLSEVLPMLENMGLTIQEEIPYDVRPASGALARIRDFEMVTTDGREIDLAPVRDAFHEAFTQVWRGTMEEDGFNRLILGAGLTAADVTVLRACCKYLRQAGIPFSQPYMEETLARNPSIAQGLVALFRRRFDPALSPRREEESRALADDVRRKLDAVTNLDEDRILRRFLNVIECMLRTNAWQRGADGQPAPYLAFKLDSARLDDLPLPRPFREIWVYSTRFEAIHLRGGRVARGGIRWSDRREDFRTEVLGLMKAQMVKNAVIVPVGSKGGFVLKQPPEAREALQAEVVRCYKSMIQGLLDLTDNLDGARVVPPRDVVRWDDDDPYLVVAADKGTATFSDHANGVSTANGFWLDDAFASGGSAGYDHKVMGITAKGGWESVKRHFREMGRDVQAQDTTCVGVGDMSGDVFGNALLLSRHLKLLGAFDHRHIFVDPSPDPAASHAERQRMFDLPRSSWADYDPKKLSKGGGVFDRKAKSVSVSPEVRACFGLEKDQVTPAELMRAILTADVDLCWFGGIGTFVKASRETHADAGDRANDALRIDAPQLRAKVVGEGANLALTQRARVELGLRGTRLNTDAIDNSGGVDCSDHEVNIKILLRDVEKKGGLTRPARNELLRTMTDEVGALVLRDNYLQTQAISVTHALSSRLVDRIGRFMRSLEAAGKLNRRIEALPDDETLVERRGVGFARSELAVLLAYAKIDLYDALLASDLPDDPAMEPELLHYFPTALRTRHAEAIGRHKLRREIIATVLTNLIVNRVGITFAHEVSEKTGRAAPDVSRAFVAARDIFRMPQLWAAVEALDGRAAALDQAQILAEAGRLIERSAVWLLREERQPLDMRAVTQAYAEGVSEVARLLPDIEGGPARAALASRAAELSARGIPEDLAWHAATLPLLGAALDVVRAARQDQRPVAQVARAYFAVGERFGFDWLRQAAAGLPADSAWDKLAVTSVVDDLYAHQSALTHSVLGAGVKGASVPQALEAWTSGRGAQVTGTDLLLAELQAGAKPTLAMLAVANRSLKSLAS